MLREYRQNLNPDYKRKINDYSKNIHQLIAHYRTHKWLEACEEINKAQGRNFFQQVNKLSKYKSKHKIPTIEENGIEFRTDEEKANIFSHKALKKCIRQGTLQTMI